MAQYLLGDELGWKKEGRKHILKRTGDSIFLTDTVIGNLIVILAVARFGKSVIAKTIYTQAADHRPLLLIDYSGEHKLSRFPNFYSKHLIRSIPDLKIIENFGFRLSDFNSPYDFACLGFPGWASNLMAKFCANKKIHGNSLSRFISFLEDLPVADQTLEYFNDKYSNVLGDNPLRTPIPYVTKIAMVGRVEGLSQFIVDEEDPNEEKTYFNFPQLVRENRNILINTHLNIEVEAYKAQMLVGKILEKLMPLVTSQKYNPFIFLDEADKLAMNWMSMETPPSSLKWLLEYATKFMKYDVSLCLISQDPNLLNRTIVGLAISLILGQIPESSPTYLKEMTKNLNWDRDSNYREFILKRKGIGVPQRFIPINCPCIMW